MSRIRGKDIILAVRKLGDTSDSWVVANLTENSHSIENEILNEQTKFKRIKEYGDNDESFEMSAYGERKDPGQMAIINAIRNYEKVEVWEIDRVQNENSAYDSVYSVCLVENVEKSNGDSFQEVSATLQVDGNSVEGELPSLPTGAAFEDNQTQFVDPTTP